MAKKNLSRSILEGGRASYNKFDRRLSNAELRVATKVHLHKLKNSDPDDAPAIPKRRPVFKEFDDKLAPVRKWMESKVGQPWDQVHSEIRQKFDTRSLAGQHIVFDHMIASVDMVKKEGQSWHRWGALYVDDDGILQKYPKEPREKRKKGVPRNELRKYFWTSRYGGEPHKVIERGKHLYWAEPIYKQYPHTMTPESNPLYYIHAYRQGERVQAKAAKVWAKMSEDQKREHLVKLGKDK